MLPGTSKGKGFAGTIKRWNFRMYRMQLTVNSVSHRSAIRPAL